MAFYNKFISSRTTEPHLPSLLTQLQSFDASALLDHVFRTDVYTVSKSTAWTGPQIAAALNMIDNAPAVTDALLAQDEVDHFRLVMRGLVLALVDEINILRTAAGLTPRTPAQAIQAIRNKIATL